MSGWNVDDPRRTQGAGGLAPVSRPIDRHAPYARIATEEAWNIPEVLEPAEGTALARLANDRLAEVCRRYPERFSGLTVFQPQDVKGAVVLHGSIGSRSGALRDGLSLSAVRR
jgi:hypothetical protein